MQEINLLTIFFTGLLTGGLTCMAVQGGLLAATIAQREEERLEEETKKTGNALPIIVFLIAKLIAYTILGALLGLFGSFFQLSISTSVFVQIAIGIFMIGMALNILEVHPIFRYFVLQPPKFLTRFVRKQSKSKDIFAPAVLGAATVFIPCGTTQAMMALAIVSSNPLLGAAVLFAFVLGTSPVFFLLGYFTTKLSDSLHAVFMRFAAFVIILLALFNINNALALANAPTFQSSLQTIVCSVSFCTDSDGVAAKTAAVSEATITVDDYKGYNPNTLTVKAGSPVTLHVNNIAGKGCVQAFTIPSLNIQKIVPVGTSADVTFTAPSEKGQIAFMCSMGMYRGVINVI